MQFNKQNLWKLPKNVKQPDTAQGEAGRCPGCHDETVYRVELFRGNQPFQALSCRACGWALEIMSWGPVTLEVPDKCARGHVGTWRLIRRLGNRRDLYCASLSSENKRCGLRQSVGGTRQGFLNGAYPAPKWETKLRLLQELASYMPEGCLWWELRETVDLTEGQLGGAVARNLKNGCIARSQQKESAPLSGIKSYRYYLTSLGYITLRRVGL